MRTATKALKRAGVRDASWDAERLLLHILECSRAHLLAHPDRVLDVSRTTRYRDLVAQRCRRRPLQHLIGEQPFWRHVFQVTPAAFIPRPETELLVDAALERMDAHAVAADIGTGSGCIALCLAAERPDATLYAVDVSAQALQVARGNARRLGLEGRVRFLQGDLLTPLEVLPQSVDMVVSNPPYVDPAEAENLQPEVRDHEPHAALFAPGGHYGAYEALAPQAARGLAAGGWLLLEVGMGMAPRVAAICQAAGFDVESVIDDLQGIPRVVVARSRRA